MGGANGEVVGGLRERAFLGNLAQMGKIVQISL